MSFERLLTLACNAGEKSNLFQVVVLHVDTVEIEMGADRCEPWRSASDFNRKEVAMMVAWQLLGVSFVAFVVWVAFFDINR